MPGVKILLKRTVSAEFPQELGKITVFHAAYSGYLHYSQLSSISLQVCKSIGYLCNCSRQLASTVILIERNTAINFQFKQRLFLTWSFYDFSFISICLFIYFWRNTKKAPKAWFYWRIFCSCFNYTVSPGDFYGLRIPSFTRT